jgi:ketosteroid isomerase-like protein
MARYFRNRLFKVTSNMSAFASRLLFAAAICLAAPAHASDPGSEQQKVVEAVRMMFVAATKDDIALFRSVTLPEFYAFDVGSRFTGDELMALINDARADGKSYVWEVTEPQVYVDGTTAWVTYINRGSVEDVAGKKDVSWLESAVLRKSDGAWRIHFLHSTRVPSE